MNISNQLMRVMIINGINHGYIHGDLHRGNIGLQVDEYGEHKFILFDYGLILKLDKHVIHQLLYALSFNDVDIVVKILLQENVIIITDNVILIASCNYGKLLCTSRSTYNIWTSKRKTSRQHQIRSVY